MRTRTFATEGAARFALEKLGYVYGGHLYDDWDGLSHVERKDEEKLMVYAQTTCWNSAEHNPVTLSQRPDGRWEAEPI